jgi:hypothetical protein
MNGTIMTTVAEIENAGYKRHHTSYIRQYVSRKGDTVAELYSGRFGEGYKVLSPNWRSTQYSFITYYVK